MTTFVYQFGSTYNAQASWGETPDFWSITYQDGVENGYTWTITATSVVQPISGMPGAGDTAFILNGTVGGSGAAATLALAGTDVISADLTVGTLWAGANAQGSMGGGGTITPESKSLPPGVFNLTYVTVVQAESYIPTVVSLDTPSNALTNLEQGIVDNNGQIVNLQTFTYDAITGLYTDIEPGVGSSQSTEAQTVSLTGTIAAQVGTIAYTTLDLSGLLTFTQQAGVDLTYQSELVIQSGGNLETTVLVMEPGEGTYLRVEQNATLALSGGATGANGPLGLDIEANADIIGGTLQSPNALVEIGTSGDGALYLSSAATADVGTVEIGGTGTLVLSDLGTEMQSNATGSLLDNGTLYVQLQATLALGNATIGEQSGDSGTVYVNNATWALANTLGIGESGQGLVDIVSAGAVQVGSTVEIGVHSGGSGTLDLASGGTMRALGDVTLGAANGASGTIGLDGAASTLAVQGDLAVGETGIGTLALTNGATLVAFGTIDVGTAGAGSGAISAAGTVQAAAIALDNGSLGVAATGLVASVTDISAGDAANGNGSITLATGATLQAETGLTIGGQGTGDLTMAAGSTIDAGATALTIGDASSGQGSLTDAGGTITAASITVGGTGTGVFDLSAAATVTLAQDLTIGESTGGIGAATLTGAGTELVANTGLTVGDSGSGALVLNGAVLDVAGGDISVGESLGAVGDLTVNTGTLIATGALDIGTRGSGVVDIQLGASIAGLSSVSLGDKSGGIGVLALSDGALESQSLSVGGYGMATLALAGDAALTTAGNAEIAGQAGLIVQHVTVDQSAWQVTQNLDVGSAGTAQLTIGNGGTVGALGTLTLGSQSWADGSASVAGAQASIQFTTLVVGGSGSGTLSLTAGAVAAPKTGKSGLIEIGAANGSTGTLTLSGSGTALNGATLDIGGAGTVPGGNGAVTVGAGAAISVADVTLFKSATVTLSGGTLATDPLTLAQSSTISGAGTISGTVSNDGSIIAAGGTLVVTGPVSGNGSLIVDQGAVLVLEGAVSAGETVRFAGTTGTLSLTDPSGFAGSIGPHAPGDVVDSTPCFVRGARIRTARGEVAVEALAVGDEVVIDGGGLRPVLWIGRRAIDIGRHPRPETVQPIRILAHAFAERVPARDLLVSPGHALFVDGALIPAEYLVNGATVRREPAERVEYFHVELDAHAVLFSENLPSESYLDRGNRCDFENGAAFSSLHPDFAPRRWAADCAPRLLAGAAVVAARRRLLARLPGLGFRRSAAVPIEAEIGTRRVRMLRRGRMALLALPPGTREVRLRAPVFVPGGLDPAENDCRSLGIAIEALEVDGNGIALGSTAFHRGFHALERDGARAWRWSDGGGVLRLPPSQAPCTLMLTLGDRPAGWQAEDGRARMGLEQARS